MKFLILGSVFLASVSVQAHELSPIPLDPNRAVSGAGSIETCPQCSQDNGSEVIPFERVDTGYYSNDVSICSSSGPGQFAYRLMENCNSSTKVMGGYKFVSRRGNSHMDNAQCIHATEYSKPMRTIEVNSWNKALNDTFLHFEDLCGPDSHNVKSDVFLLPRKTVPSMQVNGDEVTVTLQTGETVTINGATGQVISGALQDGAPDFNPDRFKRRPPNVNYVGSGISIRMDHRFEVPRIGAQTVEIKQGSKVCKPNRSLFFDSKGVLISKSDADFLSAINRACPGKNFTLN